MSIAAGRADVRERDVGELARRVGERADPHAGCLKAPQLRGRLGARAEVHRRAVGGEPLEQRPPVAELLVEEGGGGLPVLRQVELDARAARRVLHPVVPERPRVRQHGVEIERERGHRDSMVDSPRNRRAVRELRCKAGTVPPL